MYMYTCMYTSLSQNRSFSFNPLKKKKDRFWDRLMYTMYTIHIHIIYDDIHIYKILVSSPLDDLCIDIWMSVMIIYLSQNPDDKEIGYSNVLRPSRSGPQRNVLQCLFIKTQQHQQQEIVLTGFQYSARNTLSLTLPQNMFEGLEFI